MGDAEFTLVEIVGYEVYEARTIISNSFQGSELLAVEIPDALVSWERQL